jgi:phosphatidate cytidylyltransferase
MNDQGDTDGGEGRERGVTARLGDDFPVKLAAGLAMGAVALATTLAGVLPFAVLVIVVALAVSWEWGRLVHGAEAGTVIAVQMVTVALAGILAAAGLVGLGLLALPIGAILATLLSLGRNSFFSALGVLYAGLPAVVLVWLRSDPWLGLLAVLFLIAVVVAADTAGFVAGRLFGSTRLWPAVSPNKTWAGFVGALLASAAVGGIFWFAVPDASVTRLAATGAVLALVAQGGDLAESALKRRFGVKDTGTIIPGHGGIMDRVDGLIAASSVVGIAAVAIDVYSPARALLLGS